MSANPAIRVFIVDDHDMLREGLATFLQIYPDLELVGEASNGADAVRLCQELQPDVVLMDLLMPEMDGVAAIQKILAANPSIRVIALSSFGDEELVRSAIRAGATSYLLKNVTAGRLADAIRATRAGLPTLSPEVAGLFIEAGAPAAAGRISGSPLTGREVDVLALMAAGLTNAEIAQRLGVSVYTVKGHVSNILSKLGVYSRTEAVVQGLRRQLIPPA